MRWLVVAALLAGTLLVAPCAFAAEPDTEEEPPPSERRHDWHMGLNVRTDFGTHPIRLDGGVRVDAVDMIFAFDPMVFLDGQADLDLILDWHLGGGWSAMTGWRSTSIDLAGGRQWQHKSLLAFAGRLPELAGGHLRSQAGLELTVLWVKHGGGLPSDGISFETARDSLDAFNFGMFVRFEVADGF